jgi:hypothetical protein
MYSRTVIKVDQQNKQYDFEIKGAKIFATANDVHNRLPDFSNNICRFKLLMTLSYQYQL